MNVGAAAAGFSIDIVRKVLHVGNVHIFTLGVAMAVLSLITAKLFIKSEDQLVAADEPPEEQEKDKRWCARTP